MAKKSSAYSFPALLRVINRDKPLHQVVQAAADEGLSFRLPETEQRGENGDNPVEDASAIDPSLTLEAANATPPQPGTSYAGLTPAQRNAFIAWSRQPQSQAPPAFQQLYLANIEARLFEPDMRHEALQSLVALGQASNWRRNPALHRAYFLGCWLLQDGPRLAQWITENEVTAELLGVALGLQCLLDVPLTPAQLGIAIATWKLGARLPADLLKMRLDSMTAILGRPPLAHALAQLGETAIAPRPWRTSHRGLHLLIPQPDLRPLLERNMRDALAVADVTEDDIAPIGNLDALDTGATATESAPSDQPSMEELGWRLILEFGSNRSEYFDYVLTQARKLPGYSQLMDEDRRIVYRVIFRKSEMRRFWRLWDYVHGWTSTRVYLNGEELEKWKVWPYSQHLR